MPKETAEEFAEQIYSWIWDSPRDETSQKHLAAIIAARDSDREVAEEVREKTIDEIRVHVSLFMPVNDDEEHYQRSIMAILDGLKRDVVPLDPPAEDRACEGIAPQDSEPCALPLNHSGPHSYIGPYRNRRPAEDKVCPKCNGNKILQMCDNYSNWTEPCPDCHGGRQRAQELGRCDVNLWPERHDSGLHVGEHQFIPLSCANWRPVGRQRAQGK